jgi:hypothetical protein
MADKAQTRTLIVLVAILCGLALVVGLLVFALWSERRRDAVAHGGEAKPPASADIGPGPGKYWHHSNVLLPNPELSPGEVRTTDLDVICGESTKQFRHTSAAMKRRAYAEYGEAPHKNDCADTTRTTREGREALEACEIDHIISLELGGADTEANLFPQPYNPPGGQGAHAKDEVENYLHDQVCKHGMPVAEAQKKIAADWYQVYIEARLGK